MQHSSASEEGSQVQLEKTRPHSPDKLEDRSAGSIKDDHREEHPQSDQSKPTEHGGASSPQASQSIMGSELKRPTTARRPPPRVVHRHVDEQDVRLRLGQWKVITRSPVKTAFCLGGKQDMLVNDECSSSWYNRVGNFSVSVWDRRREILYGNGLACTARQNKPTPECVVNGSECYDG